MKLKENWVLDGADLLAVSVPKMSNAAVVIREIVLIKTGAKIENV